MKSLKKYKKIKWEENYLYQVNSNTSVKPQGEKKRNRDEHNYSAQGPPTKTQNRIVQFGTINTTEFTQDLSTTSVPTSGIAPLGLSGTAIHSYSEPVSVYEQRRLKERKGVSRIPEQQRIQTLQENGIPLSEINLGSQELKQVNLHRIESLASPTDNPLHPSQRDLYKVNNFQTSNYLDNLVESNFPIKTNDT